MWVRATSAGMVSGNDADKWITFLNENCRIEIPDSRGKKSREIAAAMMHQLPGGAYFQKLLKALEVQAVANQQKGDEGRVEI